MNKGVYKIVKRGLDVCFSAVLLVLLAFPMLLIAVAVRIDTPGRAIFKQIRVGKDGKLFVCLKFRTMYTSAPPCLSSRKFENRERYVTRVGRLLRKTSLDELPQLINVLKGDMSFVGPRPLILSERDVHTERKQRGVYGLRPGMTGLAQVSGRNSISDKEKIRLDTAYLYEIGFIEDIKIIGKTALEVVRGKNDSE